jgi:hypothetical protein
MPKGNVLTPDERNAIVEHRLNGVPVRAVATITSHSTTTVVNVFRDYMAEHADEHRAEVEQVRVTLVARHEDAAFTAREEAKQARRDGDRVGFARLLREERDSLREIARLTGAESAVKVDVSGQVDLTITDPRQRLTEYLVGLCPSNN